MVGVPAGAWFWGHTPGSRTRVGGVRGFTRAQGVPPQPCGHPHMARSCRRARGLSPMCHPAPRATGSPVLVALHQEPPAVVVAGPARGNTPGRPWDAAAGFNTCLPAPPEPIGHLSRSTGGSAWSPRHPPHPCGSTRASFSPLLSTGASQADTASAWETGCRLVGRRRWPNPGAVGWRRSEAVSFSPAGSPGLRAAGGVGAAGGRSWMRFLAAPEQEAARLPHGCLLRADTIEETSVDADVGNPTLLLHPGPAWRHRFRSPAPASCSLGPAFATEHCSCSQHCLLLPARRGRLAPGSLRLRLWSRGAFVWLRGLWRRPQKVICRVAAPRASADERQGLCQVPGARRRSAEDEDTHLSLAQQSWPRHAGQ